MAEFDMPIEEQIRSLARQFGSFEKRMTWWRRSWTRWIRGRTRSTRSSTSIDSTLDSISVRPRRNAADCEARSRGSGRHARIKRQAHAVMRRDHDDQTGLLKSVLVHVRNRVDVSNSRSAGDVSRQSRFRIRISPNPLINQTTPNTVACAVRRRARCRRRTASSR